MASLRYSIHLLLAHIVCGWTIYAEIAQSQAKQHIATKPPQVLLLMDYHKAKPKHLQEYVVSEKLDGIRAIWNGKQLITRNGKVIHAPACFTKDFPPFMLDGELWIGRGTFEQVLSLVQKDCRNCSCQDSTTDKYQNLWDKVGYYVFDVPTCGTTESTPESTPPTSVNSTTHCTLLERLSTLESYLTQVKTTRIHIIKQNPIANEKELFTLLQTLSEQGAEGLVLRNITAPYEPTRSPNALKLKLYNDAECKVIAHHTGKGKYANKLGSLTCEQETTQPNGTKRILRFKIGSGFSEKERENPPPLDSIITYKFYGYTKNGLPRFATFYRIYQNP